MANIMVTLQKLANENTKKTFDFNAKEAATSRDWQKMMSDTSHQREVKDLVAAGLNPVLSSGGSGAQSYTTSAASGVADSAVNAMGNVQSARTAAAATRYAAAQNAAAARYAAQMNYAAAAYAADQGFKSTKYSVDFGKGGSVAGVVDKWLEKTGSGKAITDSKLFKDASKGVQKVLNFNTPQGRKEIASFFNKINLPNNKFFRGIVLRAFSPNPTMYAINLFRYYYNKYNK